MALNDPPAFAALVSQAKALVQKTAVEKV